MSDYTPSLDEARDRYSMPWHEPADCDWAKERAEFDRMIEAVRAEERERALREAREIVVSMERAFVTSEWGTVVRKLDVMEELDARIEKEAGLK